MTDNKTNKQLHSLDEIIDSIMDIRLKYETGSEAYMTILDLEKELFKKYEKVIMTDKQWEKEIRSIVINSFADTSKNWKVEFSCTNPTGKEEISPIETIVSRVGEFISQELKKQRQRIEKCIPKEVDKFPNIYNEDEMTGCNHCIKEIRKDFPKEQK